MAASETVWPRVPYVGVGCIVVRGGLFLLVRNHRGWWSPPGGHLDFGETLEACAARETREETGIDVTNVEFLAVTNDLLTETDKHYVTVWLRGDGTDANPAIGDPGEIAEVGWFAPEAWPPGLAPYFENLLAGLCLPAAPANWPFAPPKGTV